MFKWLNQIETCLGSKQLAVGYFLKLGNWTDCAKGTAAWSSLCEGCLVWVVCLQHSVIIFGRGTWWSHCFVSFRSLAFVAQLKRQEAHDMWDKGALLSQAQSGWHWLTTTMCGVWATRLWRLFPGEHPSQCWPLKSTDSGWQPYGKHHYSIALPLL